jgi:hypothetical protein
VYVEPQVLVSGGYFPSWITLLIPDKVTVVLLSVLSTLYTANFDYKKPVEMHACRDSKIALLDARWSAFDLFYVVATVSSIIYKKSLNF